MQKNIIFRRALAKDIPQIMELQTNIFHGEQKIPAEVIGDFLEKAPMCWCAVSEGVIIGAAAAWEEGGALHWGRFVVDSEYRGLHIGTQLARFSFDDIFSLGYEQIYMEARELTAQLVCKMGGRVVGGTTPFYEGTVTPLILKKEWYCREQP